MEVKSKLLIEKNQFCLLSRAAFEKLDQQDKDNLQVRILSEHIQNYHEDLDLLQYDLLHDQVQE